MNNAQVSSIVYEEKFGSLGSGSGSLVVKQLRRDGSVFALIGYVHAGIDIAPVVFARGSMDECRKNYRAAKDQMNRWYPN